MNKLGNGRRILKAGVLLIAALLFLSTTTGMAIKDQSPEAPAFSARPISVDQSSPDDISFDEVWLHYDDGTNYNAIGLTSGGTYEAAIRLTPTELTGYSGWNLTVVRFYHYVAQGTSESHSGNIKIYGAGSQSTPGSLIATKPYTVTGEGWKEIPLTTPILIALHDYWISVQVTHAAGEYPIGVDAGPAIPYKGDWVYAGGWQELRNIGTPPLNYNWNLWGKVQGGSIEDTTPPVTTCDLEGEMQGDIYISDVTVTLTATDDMSGVNYTKYKVDDGAWTTYTDPFVVSEDGDHTVYFYSVDNAENQEEEKTCSFTIQLPCPIIIEKIAGGIGVTVTVKNNGTENLTGVEWRVAFEGFVFPKEKTGTIDLAAGEEKAFRVIVIGFGKTTISVTVGCADAMVNGTVFLIFVIGVK